MNLTELYAAEPPVLTGTVTDPDGRPLAGVNLVVLTREPSMTSYLPPAAPPTGPDGTFAIPDLPEGRVQIQGFLPGYQSEFVPVCRRGERFRLILRPLDGTPRGPDGKPVTGPGLFSAIEPGCDVEGNPCPADLGTRVEGCQRMISGWIVDANGAPLEGARVITEMADQARTFQDGRFGVLGLPSGPIPLTVERAGYKTIRRTIDPFSGELRLVAVLARDEGCDCMPVPLSGRVIGPDNAPLAGALVVEMNSKTVESAADGSFELHPTTREPTTVWAQKTGFAPAEIEVDPTGGPADRLEIRLQPGITVTGRLLGLSPGEVTLIRAICADPISNPTDAEESPDRYELSDLAPGEWTIYGDVIYGGPGRSARRTIEIPRGVTEMKVDLDFTPEAKP